MSFRPERADFNPKLGVREEAKKLWELLCSFFFFFQARLYYGPCCSRGSNKQVPLLAPRGGVRCVQGVTGGVA